MNDVLGSAPGASRLVRLPVSLHQSHVTAQASHFIRHPSMERDARVLQPMGHSASSSREYTLQHQQLRAALDQPATTLGRGAPVPTTPLADGLTEGLQTATAAAKENRKREKSAPSKGDIRQLDKGKRKRYNGRQWRTLCNYPGCEKEAQGKTDVCSRHLSRTPVHIQQKGLKGTGGMQKHCLSLTSSLPPLNNPSGTSTPTEEDSQDSLSFGAASGKRSCSSVSELSNTSPISNDVYLMSEREQEAVHGLVSLSNSRTNTPFPHTPISSPDFTMQGKLPQAFSTPSSQQPHSTSGHVEGLPCSKRGQFQRHSSQGSLLDEGIYMSRQTCASVPPLTEDRMDASSMEETKQRHDTSELDVPPEDMELACMESSDSALPEDFPNTASESQLSITASSSTCLLSEEGTLAASMSTATTAMDLSDSYEKLPPLRQIARCPTRQRMELMSQLARSHSLPDLKSNVYELQAMHSVSPPSDAVHVYPVQFTEKLLLKAHQPKVCSSYVSPSNETPMDQYRLPQVSTGNGQPLVKSQVSAFFTPQKEGAIGSTPHGLPHSRDGVRFRQSGPSPSVNSSPPTWVVCGSGGVHSTMTTVSRSERTVADIARLSLHSSSPSPVGNPDLLTPPFTPSQVTAPPLPHPPNVDGTAPFSSAAVKRNGGFPRHQVHIAPKSSSSFDAIAAQQLMSNSFKRKRARSSAPLEDNQSTLVRTNTAEQELPPISNPPQQKLFSCRKNYPKQKEMWCSGCERKKGGCSTLNALKKRL